MTKVDSTNAIHAWNAGDPVDGAPKVRPDAKPKGAARTLSGTLDGLTSSAGRKAQRLPLGKGLGGLEALHSQMINAVKEQLKEGLRASGADVPPKPK